MPAKKNARKNDPTIQTLVDAARAMINAAEARDFKRAQNALESMGAALAGINPSAPADWAEMLATLQINTTTLRAAGTGTWVSGTIAGHGFEALVFPEHAQSEAYELGHSRISKLHIHELFTDRQVAAFDRGWDIKPSTDDARRITDLLAAGLAETVFGK